jgi:DNA-binding SARP family transcriptional activator/pimeloyl-ACP methyl ester carboxylesterase
MPSMAAELDQVSWQERSRAGNHVRARETGFTGRIEGRMLRLQLLGEVEVLRGEERLELPPSKKTRALLAYLAMSGRPHRRERLCELFWNVPDDPRGSLRWSLSKLRGVFDEPGRSRLLADRQTVALDTVGLSVDLLEARQRVAAGVKAASVEDLAQATAAFRGEFLADLDLPDSHGFRAWCAAVREDARKLHVQILTELAERLPAQDALPYARDLVSVDSYNEPGWALLIRALVAAGRRPEAEQQHETACRVLKEVGGPAGPLIRAWREARAVAAASGAAATVELEPGAAMADTATAAVEEPASQQIRFCRAEGGIRIAYATVGRGPPLVKPANWMTHLEYDWQSPVWRHWISALSRDRCLIRYDERANGLSDWDVDDLSFDACVRDLEAVVDANRLERFPMLGISQGCAIAIAYAVRHPERVSRLVLYGGYARGWMFRGSPTEVARRRALGTLIEHGWGQDNPAFRQVFTTMFIPEASPEQVRWFNDLQRVTASPANASRLHEMFGQVAVEELLPQVRVPTLVLHSRQEGVVPFEEGRLIATGIPGARFVPLESRNHILLESEPAWGRFVAEMRSFLSAPDV